MTRGWLLTVLLLLEGLWLAADIPLVQGLGETNEPFESSRPVWLFYIWLTSDALLLCSVLLVWLWSKSGVVGFVVVTAIREGLLVYSGKSPSLIGGALALVLVALVYKHWWHMQWGIIHAQTPAPAGERSAPAAEP